MYSKSTLKRCTEYYLKNVRFDAVMFNAPQMAHFRRITVIAGAAWHITTTHYRFR